MSEQHTLPMDLHTADYFQKTKALRHNRKAWTARTWWVLFGLVTVFLVFMMGPR